MKAKFSIFLYPIWIVFLLFLMILSGFGFGQNHISETPAGLPSPAGVVAEPGEKENFSAERIQEARKAAADSADLDGETRAKLLEVYDKALAQWAQIQEFRAQIGTYQRMRQGAPSAAAEAQAALASAVQEPPAPDIGGQPAPDLEKDLAAAQLALEEARRAGGRMGNEPRRRAERRTRIPEEINTAQEQFNQIKAQFRPVPAEPNPLDPAYAARLHQQVQMRALQLKIDSLREEEKTYAATEKLLALQRDLAARQLTAADQRFRRLDEAVRLARIRETERLQARVEQDAHRADSSHEAVRQLARENADLVRLQTERIRQAEQAARYAVSIETKLKDLTKEYESVRVQISRAGKVTSALGVLLLAKKNNLPDLRDHQRQIRQRIDLSSLAQFEWSKYDRQWSDLTDVQSHAGTLLAAAGLGEFDESYAEAFRESVLRLQEQREILRKLTAYTMDYLTTLAQLDIQERSLVSTVREYERFIDENIFWVKNTPALGLRDLTAILPAIRELVRFDRWKQTGLSFWQDVRADWVLYGILAVGLFLLIRSREWTRRKLEELTGKVRHVYSDRYLDTLSSLGLTVLLVLPWPLAAEFLSWRLLENAALFPATASLGLALYYTAIQLFVYKGIRWFCAQGGLGEHFRLSNDFLRIFRRHVTWYFQILIPLMFFYYLFSDPSIEEEARNSILRFLFLGRQILMMLFLLIVLRPSGGLIGPYLKKGSWPDHLKYVWYGLCWLVPLVFCYLSILGYGYTAHQLHQRLLYTLILLLMVFFLNGMLVRWLYVAEGYLMMKQRREQGEGEPGKNLSPSVRPSGEEDPLMHLSRQTRKLINMLSVLLILVGAFWIWKTILPALGALEEIPLWKTADAQGQPAMITLAGLLKALAILVMTVIVTRNVPGFLEVSVLQRFPFDTGFRFAITSVTRYLLCILGIILVSSEIGLRWSKVQWLVAALSVGLGFGLQEIVANFICGLLLLFERPLRVGDVVTIGEVTGRVTRIQIRATTILLWDRKELVVPNREFITGRLVNWTLSDTILRLVFPVGVAYGSDIQKTEAVLYRIAAAHPQVIHDDPKPWVVFDGFGDSALRFELRLFIPTMEYLLQVKHEINSAIDTEFRKEGIEIAFPQRDLHIRSIQAPLPIRREEEQK